MLTYVINTSENKTFESDKLFEFVGYNKIRWMNCKLNDIEAKAEEICDRQSAIDADEFRIAVLIDFYAFDKIRPEYGSEGFLPVEKDGVDISVYYPYIKAYLLDHLFYKIEKKSLRACEQEVFYIQNVKNNDFSHLDNRESQVKLIMQPEEESLQGIIRIRMKKSDVDFGDEKVEWTPVQDEVSDEERKKIEEEYEAALAELKRDFNNDAALRKKNKEKEEKEVKIRQEEADEEEKREAEKEKGGEEEEIYVELPEKKYSKFRLHCSDTVSLTFSLADYPYTNEKGLTFGEFFAAFKQREYTLHKITEHQYVVPFDGGAAKAAFNNLSLFLYLIKKYECEESVVDTNNELVVDKIDKDRLKNALIVSWNKIHSARRMAVTNNSDYYDIKSYGDTAEANAAKVEDERSKEEKLKETREKLTHEERFDENTVEQDYDVIYKYATSTEKEWSAEFKKEFDEIMLKYLQKRDDTKESSIKGEYDELIKNDGSLRTVKQFPSRSDFETAVDKKKDEIAALLKKSINAEYLGDNLEAYKSEKKKADKAYAKYLTAKQSIERNFAGDLAFWFFVVLTVVLPFALVQRRPYGIFSAGSLVLYLITTGVVTGLFVLAFLLHYAIIKSRMKRARRQIRECFINCQAIKKYAFTSLKQCYDVDLTHIEELRYEIGRITYLNELNAAKNEHMEMHRKKLEEIEDKLSGMLNNLGVEPIVTDYDDLGDEFDVTKPFLAPENRVYKVFSIEVIESLFNKGRS